MDRYTFNPLAMVQEQPTEDMKTQAIVRALMSGGSPGALFGSPPQPAQQNMPAAPMQTPMQSQAWPEWGGPMRPQFEDTPEFQELVRRNKMMGR